MSAILDAVYLIGILLVAVTGLFGVWWVSRDQGEPTDRATSWRGLLVAAASSLFVIVLVAQFLWYLLNHGI